MRRLLLLSYYYAPAGGSGVQRATKLGRYLLDYGWTPTVVTVDPAAAAFPATDPALLADVPAAVHVEHTGTWDPYAMYAALRGQQKTDVVTTGFAGGQGSGAVEGLARWVRANLFIPDARAGWVPYAVASARRLHRNEPFDALLTTGPPHSTHIAGWWLARTLGLPWVADLRDPWTDIYYYRELPRSALARRLDMWLEKTVLRRATARIAVGPALAAHYEAKLQRPVAVVPNGFDAADFPDVSSRPDPASFVLAYVGTFLAQQNPTRLWGVLARLREQGRIPALRLRLVGALDPSVHAALDTHGLLAITEVVPYVSHPDAIAAMQQAEALLLCINEVPGAELIVTGKIFEYVASGRPVLGIGPPQGDAAAVLTRSGAGPMLHWDDAAAIEAQVLAWYDAWARRDEIAGASPEGAAPYSRQRQAEAVARLLDAVT